VAHPGAMEARFVALEAHLGALVAHPGISVKILVNFKICQSTNRKSYYTLSDYSLSCLYTFILLGYIYCN
jgi:hypothetical protein